MKEQWEGLPSSFIASVQYIRGDLNVSAKPDYDYMRKILMNIFEDSKFELDWQYDWATEYILVTQLHTI